MALTPSTMLPLGTPAPAFSLKDTDGKWISLDSAGSAKGYLIVFLCNHCPYVKHIRRELASVTGEYLKKGIAVFGINSNDAEKYPEDRPEMMAREKRQFGYLFPYLYDESQSVAKAYQAACTPEFYLFDAQKKLVYRGQFDSSRPGNNIPVTGSDLRAAMENLLAGTPVPSEQTPSVGCNIKWKPGNEPPYFG